MEGSRKTTPTNQEPAEEAKSENSFKEKKIRTKRHNSMVQKLKRESEEYKAIT